MNRLETLTKDEIRDILNNCDFTNEENFYFAYRTANLKSSIIQDILNLRNAEYNDLKKCVQIKIKRYMNEKEMEISEAIKILEEKKNEANMEQGKYIYYDGGPLLKEHKKWIELEKALDIAIKILKERENKL